MIKIQPHRVLLNKGLKCVVAQNSRGIFNDWLKQYVTPSENLNTKFSANFNPFYMDESSFEDIGGRGE